MKKMLPYISGIRTSLLKLIFPAKVINTLIINMNNVNIAMNNSY